VHTERGKGHEKKNGVDKKVQLLKTSPQKAFSKKGRGMGRRWGEKRKNKKTWFGKGGYVRKSAGLKPAANGRITRLKYFQWREEKREVYRA